MKLDLISPARTLVKDLEVSSVTLTGDEGEIEILPGHANMAGTLETGRFSYEGSSSDQGFISTGFFEVTNDKVSVLAEVMERKSEIDSSRAQKAQQTAQEKLQDPNLSPSHFKKYQLKVQRAIIRQQLAK